MLLKKSMFLPHIVYRQVDNVVEKNLLNISFAYSKKYSTLAKTLYLIMQYKYTLLDFYNILIISDLLGGDCLL